MTDTKQAMMEAAMDIIAEKGLDGFSMKQVTNRIHMSEALLYKYFVTKENFLQECFLYVNSQIADLFVNVSAPTKMDQLTKVIFVRTQWERYFRFMVENGSRSLFYYAYRDSNYIHSVLIRNNTKVAREMEPFMALVSLVAEGSAERSGIPGDYIWLFLLESTGAFVKHAIRHGVKAEDIDVDSVWRLVAGGLSSLAN